MKLPKFLKTAKGRRATAKLVLDVTSITSKAAISSVSTVVKRLDVAEADKNSDASSYDGFGLQIENSRQFTHWLPSDGIGGVSERNV